MDVDPAKAGRDLGEIAEVGRPLKVAVSVDVRRTIRKGRPDVVVLCTSSSLRSIVPQLETILKMKVPVVSTTEELSYPTRANLRYARAIHQMAKRGGGGARDGSKPRVPDALPITLTGVCERVEAVRVARIQDARIRRLPFQQKIGAGLTREQFQRKVEEGTCDTLGWPSRCR